MVPGMRRRFLLAYVLLAILLGGAAALAVVLLGRSGGHHAASTAPSPAFHPTGVGTAALQQIAVQVGREYRLPDGEQFVAAIARPAAPPQLVTPAGAVVISAVVLHTGFSLENPGDVVPVDFTKGAIFILCGAGRACAIPGQPSNARGDLLRRLTVELALRTLQKLVSIDSVLVFLPPLPGTADKRFFLLTRTDLAAALAQPLSSTLTPATRLVPGSLSAAETQRLRRLTDGRAFLLTQVQQLPDGTALLEGTPPQPIG
jgi:hypothetical protein